MRVVREVETRFGVRGTPADIEPEGTNFPVRGNRSHHEEGQDQPGEEQQETNPPAPAAVCFVIREPHAVERPLGLHRHGSTLGHDPLVAPGGSDGTGILHRVFGLFGLRVRAGTDRGSASGELGQPLVQHRLIQVRSPFLRVRGTPMQEAHLRPPYCRAITTLVSRVAVWPCRCNSVVARDLQPCGRASAT